ncbi:MAG: hypothetical protein GF353_10840 [Candidatus Lokiarchaeota archaeon]|nr:hypothetical protein [Candidatus Lokiarchaeota archaeon]
MEIKTNAENALRSLREILQQIDTNSDISEIKEKKEQLISINKTINELKNKNISIPEEVQTLKIKLVVEIEKYDTACSAIGFIENEMNILRKEILSIKKNFMNNSGKINEDSGSGKTFDNPRILIIDNHQYKISKWYEVLIIVGNYILKKGKRLPSNRQYGVNILVSQDPNRLKAPKKLENGFFIATKYNKQLTLNYARQLLIDCGLNCRMSVITEKDDRISPKI